MKTIYILTPSVTRPDCHIRSVIPFVNNIYESNIFENVVWFVNIDRPLITKRARNGVGHFEFEQMDFTVKNFKKTVKKEISLNINESNSPCFYKAFSHLFSSVKNHIESHNLNDDEFCILWLEDDWKLTRRDDFYRDLNLFISKPNIKFYTLYKHKLNIGGNPQIIKGDLYTSHFKNMDISLDNKRDPEVIMRNEIFREYIFDPWVFKAVGMEKHIFESKSLTFKDKISIANDLIKKYTDTFFVSNGMYGNVVEDIGDLWRWERGFRKWDHNQKENGINSDESYTYI